MDCRRPPREILYLVRATRRRVKLRVLWNTNNNYTALMSARSRGRGHNIITYTILYRRRRIVLHGHAPAQDNG